MYMKLGSAVSAIFLLVSSHAFAAAYRLPSANESLIGQMQTVYATDGDNVVKIAHRFDIGFNAVENANPDLDVARRFVPGSAIQISTQHLLPNLPRHGIVINLPEMRMYYYPAGTDEVLTYPIGIGRIGKTIPIKMTTITYKMKNPTWKPTKNIREFNLEQGVVLPSVMPAGPDNPLGPYAIYTGIPTYLIHSTIFPESIGKRASFGCIRMYESDIQDFFPSVKGGISVAIINSPVKVGWQQDALFVEAHEPLEEHSDVNASVSSMVHLVSDVSSGQDTLVDWQMIAYLADDKDGVPHQVGTRIR